jgi:MFS family permease
MIDRVGSRKTFLIGGIVTLAGWMLLSTVKLPWQLYLYYGGLMALAVSMTHAVPIQATTRKWFKKRAGLVAGITASAFAVGTSIFMPLMTGMADSHGWRYTSLICGVSFSVVIMLVAFFIIRNTPESMGLYPDDESALSSENLAVSETSSTVREATKTSQFWLLFITYSMIGIPIQGTLASLVAWGVDVGSTKASAGLFITALTIPSIAGKVGGGWLGDKYGRRRLIFIGAILGMLVMLYGWQVVYTQRSLMVFAILMGIVYGLPFALFTPYLGDLFGRAYVGSLFGLITLGHGLIGGCGPLIWGRVCDAFGSYNVACLISAVCYVVAAIAMFFVQPLKATRRSLES